MFAIVQPDGALCGMGGTHCPAAPDDNSSLRGAAGVIFPFNTQGPTGEVSMSLGVKGIVYFELEAKGGDVGGPVGAEVHGSSKALVDSPTLRLVQAIASMT